MASRRTFRQGPPGAGNPGIQWGMAIQPSPDNLMENKGAADLVARILEGTEQGGESMAGKTSERQVLTA